MIAVEQQAATSMSMTLAEKILAHASRREQVRAGEIVSCDVDLAMMHDSSGPRRIGPKLEELGVDIWDADKVVIITDHFVGETDSLSVQIKELTRDWASQRPLRGYHEAQGICHVVLPERGHLRPGMFVVGGDSHSTTGGAFGCFMTGIGATDMAGVLATGNIWMRVRKPCACAWMAFSAKASPPRTLFFFSATASASTARATWPPSTPAAA